MLFEYLANRIRALAERRGWPIIPVLLIVVSVIWDIIVFSHTLSWLIERHPTIGWLGTAATNHLVSVGLLAIGVVWLSFWLRPAKPTITSPRNRDVVGTPFTVSGTHDNQTGNYWLATNAGNDFWPKSKVIFRPDRRWDEQINVGRGQNVTVSLVKVDDIVQRAFESWSRNANREKDWRPFTFPSTTTKEDITKVDSIVVLVAATPKP
jgi:hypothetical protein